MLIQYVEDEIQWRASFIAYFKMARIRACDFAGYWLTVCGWVFAMIQTPEDSPLAYRCCLWLTPFFCHVLAVMPFSKSKLKQPDAKKVCQVTEVFPKEANILSLAPEAWDSGERTSYKMYLIWNLGICSSSHGGVQMMSKWWKILVI